MFCSWRKNTAWDSRSENRATRTLAPVTSLRPELWTWIAARWMTRSKACGRFGVDHALDREAGELVIQEIVEVGAQPIDLDRARLEHRRGVFVIGERHQQMLEGGVFVLPGVGEGQRPTEGLFEVARQHGHPRRPLVRFLGRVFGLVPTCPTVQCSA